MFTDYHFHAASQPDEITVRAKACDNYASIVVIHNKHEVMVGIYLSPDQARHVVDELDKVATPKPPPEPMPEGNTNFAKCTTPDEMQQTMYNIIKENVCKYAVKPEPAAPMPHISQSSIDELGEFHKPAGVAEGE